MIRLKNDSHGQTEMNLLDKYGIEYPVTKTFKNGVRVDNVPDHVNPRKRRNNGQIWFPSTWSQKDIQRAGQHVAGLKGNRRVLMVVKFLVYIGVRIPVVKTNGKISTVFPD